MNKLLLLLCAGTFALMAEAQTPAQDAAERNSCIDGASARSDIDGVELVTVQHDANERTTSLIFTNRNRFGVSVDYELETTASDRPKTVAGTLVLKGEETKRCEKDYVDAKNIRWSVRPLKGMLSTHVEQLPIKAGYLIEYPKSLGELYIDEATDAIRKLNDKKVYGHSNWRLPTVAELNILGYSDTDAYYHRNRQQDKITRKTKKLIIVSDTY